VPQQPTSIFPDEQTAPLRSPSLEPATPFGTPRSIFPEEPDRLADAVASPDAAPDAAARELQLRLKTGLAPGVVRRHAAELEQLVARQGFDAEAFRLKSPVLAKWLEEDKHRAAVTLDDLPQLQALEQVPTFAMSVLKGIDRLQATGGRFLQAVGETTAFKAWVDGHTAGQGDTGILARYGRQVAEFNDAQAATLGGDGAFDRKFDGPWEFAQWVKQSLGEQVPQMAPGMAGGIAGAGFGGMVAGPPGAVVGGLIGAFLPSFASGVGETRGNVAQNDPEAEGGAGVWIGGTAIAAFDSVLPGKIGSRLVRTFGEEAAEAIAKRALTAPVRASYLRRTVGGAVTGMASEGVTEAVQEAIGQVAGSLDAGTPINSQDVWNAMVEAGATGALLGGVLSGGTAVAETRANNKRVSIGEQQKAVFDALASGVTDSKTLARAPEVTREFLQRVTKDGPLEHLYIPADAFEQYWQSKGLPADLMAAELTGQADALEASKANGGTLLVIPTALYATKIAATEHHAFFAQELKLRPNLPSVREEAELEQARKDVEALEPEARAQQAETSRESVQALLLEKFMAAGQARTIAEPLAAAWAARYAKRAEVLGVDPLTLYSQRPIEAETALSDGPGPGRNIGEIADIPGSRPAKGETFEDRGRRRDLHLSALTATLTRDAQRVDPSVTAQQIRAELEARIGLEEERQQVARESGGGQDLLKAIAGYGGMWWEARTGGFKGEVEKIALEGQDARTRAEAVQSRKVGKRSMWNGVAGVFSEAGLPPDRLLTSLRQDARFEHLQDVNELFDAIEQAVATDAELDEIPGTAQLEALGITPGKRWWSDTWQAPEEDVDESPLGDDEGADPDSFEFAQRAVERLRALKPAPAVWGGAVRPPFPIVADQVGDKLLRAAEKTGHVEQVPIGAIVATQAWLSPDISGEYADGTRSPRFDRQQPVVLHLNGRYYLADGHHRAAGAWAKGEPTVAAEVREVDATKLEGGEPTEFQQRNAGGRAKAKAARAEARAKRENRLVAVHNLTAANVRHADRMGGLAVPSLAIMRKGEALTGFGEITLVGPRTLIDPRNGAHVYGADVYAPRYPTVHYKVDAAGERTLTALYKKHADVAGEQYIDLDSLTKDGARYLEHSGSVMAEFLLERGIELPAPVKHGERASSDYYRDKVDPFQTRYALEYVINKHELDEEFKDYASRLFASLRPTERIFRGFTNQGNRSYKPHSLENVVAILKKELRGGESAGNIYGVGQLRAKFTPRFRSLEAIRDAADRLVTEDEFAEVKHEVETELFAIADSLKPRYTHQADPFRFTDTVIAVLEEAPRRGIVGALREYGFEDVDSDTLQDIAEYLQKLRTLPTEYFEVKLTRAVGLEEFAGAVVPTTVDEATVNILRERGLIIGVYDKDIDGGRQYAVAKLSDQLGDSVLFQRDPSLPDGFYSRVLRAVEASTLAKASGAQWKATIRNAKSGINLDEYHAIAIDALEDGRTYTRNELLDYVREHQVEVDVVELKGDGDIDPDLVERRAQRYYDDAVDEWVRDNTDPPTVDRGRIKIDSEEVDDGEEWVAFYKGDEVARAATKADLNAEIDSWADAEDEELEQQHEDELRENAGEHVSWSDAEERAIDELKDEGEAEGGVKFADYVEDGADEGTYREVFLTAPQAKGDNRSKFRAMAANHLLGARASAENATYAPGIIENYRRLIPILEQLAVAESFAPFTELATEDFVFIRASFPATYRALNALAQGETWEDGHGEYSHIKNPVVRIRLNARTLPDGRKALFLEEIQPPQDDQQGLMPALFLKSWRELAFKWALHEAAANQYDVLAWTTGQMQVTRYPGVAEHVSRLQITGWDYRRAEGVDEYAEGEGNARIVSVQWRDVNRQQAQIVVDKSGTVLEVIGRDRQRNAIEGRSLSAVLGRDIADRILSESQQFEVAADGLEIGGAGLRKLYDVDFPTVVNKLTKRAGGKVATAALTKTETYRLSSPDAHGGLWAILDSQNREIYTLPGDAEFEERARTRLAVLNEGARVAAVPAVEITPAIRDLALAGQALFQDKSDDVKGSFNPRTNRILLVAGKADLSTFLHESGHAFLEELVEDAITLGAVEGRTVAQDRAIADATTVLKWFGFQGTPAEWLALSVADRRDQHERWARGFEAYLLEGKAPTPELRQLFARFRTWLVGVYRTLQGLRRAAGADFQELSPEVRGVMDRLLATDAQLEAAQAEQSVTALFTDAASAGVDALTFAAHRSRIEEANLAAREQVDRELMREWRRERQAWWQQERDTVRRAVAEELSLEPAFAAQSVIRTGKLPNGAIPDFGDGAPMKLSRADIMRQFGPDVLKALPKPYLYTVEGGIGLDVAAELFKFGSADAMLKALMAAPPVQRVIDAEADTRMRERHGDMLLEGMTLKDSADAAVADQRAAIISAELQMLTAGMAGQRIPSAAATRAAVAARVASTPVRELRPGLALQAARRASQKAFDLFGKNDRAGAIEAKRQELAAVELYRQARDAKERATKRRDALTRYANDNATRGRVGKAGADYLDQIDGFLHRYEFARVSQRVLNRRAALGEWVKGRIAEGIPVNIPEEVLADSRQVNWQQLTVDELEGVYEAVTQIAHLAGLKNKLLKSAKGRALLEITTELATSIREHKALRARTAETHLPAEEAAKLRRDVFASHRKIASLAREMDGFADGGPVWEYIIRPMNEAANEEAAMNAEATKRLYELFARYSPAERSALYRLEHRPALGAATDPRASMSKAGILVVALNWGNETNRQRMRDGHGWTDTQVQALLDTLDRRDWEFVQSTWDFIEEYWPAIKAKEERVNGVAPPKVEAVPVFTRFGEFRGGYYPIKFNGELSPSAATHQDVNFSSLQQFASHVAATTARNHTQRRAEGDVTDKAVRLDFGPLFLHVGQVIHDLTHHEMLIDVGRIMRNEDVAQAIYETHGEKVYQQFKNAMRDIAFGDVPARDGMERAINHLRQGATVVGLGWSLTTALLQPLGMTQSWKRIGAKWVGVGIGKWLSSSKQTEGTVKWIYARSTFMRLRGLTQQREINEIRNQIGVDTGAGWINKALQPVPPAARQAITDSFFRLIQIGQLTVDVPTWLGAYEKAMADPANVREDGTIDEARVVALADQAVLDSQGGGQIKDMASVQRGSAYLKLLTNFYSFFNTTFNLWSESVHEAQYRKWKSDGQAMIVGRLMVDYLALFLIPATLGTVVRGLMKSGDDDDDESFVKDIVGANLAYMAGTMVGLRELGGAVQGFTNYEGPAGNRAFASASKVLAASYKAAEAGDASKALTPAALKAFVETGGAILHFPAAQSWRTLTGMAALMEGKTRNPGALVVGYQEPR
jgi:hypothetical protein